MSRDLPIWIREPRSTGKRDLLARKLFRGGWEAGLIPETASVDDIRRRLKRIREYAHDHIHSLTKELETTLSQKYQQVAVKSALDDVEAIKYIIGISGGIDTISINDSSIVSRELKPGLVANGFTVINSYLNEFDVKERKILDYWDLPHLVDNNITGTFDVSIKMVGIDQLGVDDTETMGYLAVLGVNAVSAEDGTVFFLQHFFNIHRDLRQAEKVILVIGLDKIAKSREDAAFVSECIGIFGMESSLLGIQPKASETLSLTELSLPPVGTCRELHVIILDNGRINLLKTQFRNLFLCIGCRACNEHCPIRHSFSDVDYIWSPKNYLNEFLDGKINSIDVCLHCESCRLDCPLDIDLPNLMWQAKIDYISEHGRSFYHKILGMPEMLARFGTYFTPLANWMMNNKLVRILMELMLGIDRKANLPKFHRLTFRKVV